MTELDVAVRSEAGTAHPYEDRVLVDKELGFFAVADGVTNSSHGSGAVGAELVLELLHEKLKRIQNLVDAITEANELAVARAREDDNIGQTTLSAAWVEGDRLHFASVGDSLVFLVRNGGNNVWSIGGRDKDPRGYITQWLPWDSILSIHAGRVLLSNGDIVLVASDGVANAFYSRLVAGPTADDVATTIINKAKAEAAEYDDDKSVIVLKVV